MQIGIISRDKGFSAVSDFFGLSETSENVTVCVAPNIESALQALTAPEDADRRRLIKEKAKPLSIVAEQARMREHRAFVEARDVKQHRLLYTGALHEFGRKDGGEIYRKLKNVI